jgi:hypothetical protein
MVAVTACGPIGVGDGAVEVVMPVGEPAGVDDENN